MNNTVILTPYNPNWPPMFEAEAMRIQNILGDNCVQIHHIGSTSIPGLVAKPIIDMVPVVKDIQAIDGAVSKKLEHLGYSARGELGMAFRGYFSHPNFHLHIWEEGSDEITKHLLFRDYMRLCHEDRQAYENLKKDLAKQFHDNRKLYTLNKESFIRSILKKAGFHGYTLVEALTKREWEAYHRIRRVQLFDPMGIVYDPHHPSITSPHSTHFVLGKGDDIVSVGMLESLDTPSHKTSCHNGKCIALRSLATDPAHINMGHGTYLLKKLERWCKHHGYERIHLHALHSALPFYKRCGYEEMPFDDVALNPDSIKVGKVL